MIIGPQFYALAGLMAISIAADLIVAIPSSRFASSREAAKETSSPTKALKKRVAAYATDLVVVLLLTGALAWTFGPAAGIVWPIFVIFIGLAYPFLCYRFTGVTLGQRLAGLRRQISAARNLAVGWSVVGFVFMLFGFPFGFLSALFDERRRTVEEKLALVAFSP